MSCVAVVGGNRCGTSLTAGLLHHLGVVMALEFVATLESNPLGHFEDVDFLQTHRAIFGGGRLGSGPDEWRNPPEDPPALSPDFVERTVSEHRRLVREREEANPLWGIKDPRLCFLFPLLAQALQAERVEVRVVTVHRNVDAAAKSIFARENEVMKHPISKQEAVVVAERYEAARRATLLFIRVTRPDVPILRMEYDRLVDDSATELPRLASFVDREVTTEAEELVRPDLRHHR